MNNRIVALSFNERTLLIHELTQRLKDVEAKNVDVIVEFLRKISARDILHLEATTRRLNEITARDYEEILSSVKNALRS